MAFSLYSLFRFLHVICAIFAMGPHFIASILLKYLDKDPESAPTITRLLKTINMMPKHGAIFMLLTGVLMLVFNTAGLNVLKEVWLIASLALFVFTAAYGRIKGEPAAGVLVAAVQRGRLNPEEIRSLSQRMNNIVSVMGVSLVAIVVLMILKPTF